MAKEDNDNGIKTDKIPESSNVFQNQGTGQYYVFRKSVISEEFDTLEEAVEYDNRITAFFNALKKWKAEKKPDEALSQQQRGEAGD